MTKDQYYKRPKKTKAILDLNKKVVFNKLK